MKPEVATSEVGLVFQGLWCFNRLAVTVNDIAYFNWSYLGHWSIRIDGIVSLVQFRINFIIPYFVYFRMNKLLVVSDTYDPLFPTIPIEVPHGRDYLSIKTFVNILN